MLSKARTRPVCQHGIGQIDKGYEGLYWAQWRETHLLRPQPSNRLDLLGVASNGGVQLIEIAVVEHRQHARAPA